MNIGVYCDPLSVVTSGTPGRGMLKHLISSRPNDSFILIVRRGYEKKKQLAELISEILSANANCRLHVESRSTRKAHLFALLGLSDAYAVSVDVDVFVNTDGTALGRHNHPLIITLADLSVFKGRSAASFSNMVSYFLRRKVLRQGIIRADRIITVSQTTKLELMNTFGVADEQVQVVYNGIAPDWFSPDYSTAKNSLCELPAKYWIWWGHISPRKNLVRLFTAYAKCCESMETKSLPTLLIVYSNPMFPPHLHKLANELGINQRIIVRQHLPLNELIAVVSQSSGLVFPSIVEGFGVPIAEAMARGVPVMTSDVSATREVAGPEATFCDPFSIESIQNALVTFASRELQTSWRRERRQERSRQFTYTAAATGYSRVINSVYGN